MSLISFAAETLKKQRLQIYKVHEKTGISKCYLWYSFFKWYLLYGVSPSDWLNYRMWEMSRVFARQFITARDNDRLDSMYNPRDLVDTFTNKVKFNKDFAEFVHRDWLFTEEHSVEEIKEWCLNIKDIVVKPINLSSGRGIAGYHVNNENIDSFIDTIGLKKNKDCEYLFEKQVENIDQLKRLNPPSCQTIRIYTIVKNDNSVSFLAAAIRVGGSDNVVDNFHAKGTAFPIDIETGMIYGTGIDADGNKHLVTPSTGVVMPGFQIPCWNEVKSFVEKAAKHKPQARFIGWDVAVTPDGCDMIEGNVEPNHNFLQIFDHVGRKKELYSYK